MKSCLLVAFVAVALATLIAPTHQYFITVDANSEDCFFDRVLAGTKLGLTFEVVEGGFLDIDVSVSKTLQNPFKSAHN